MSGLKIRNEKRELLREWGKMIRSVRKKLFLTTALVLLGIILILAIFNSLILRGALYDESSLIELYIFFVALITAVLRKHSCFFNC